MSDKDGESTDDDLIREILDLRPDQDPGDSATAEVECDDPFATDAIPQPPAPIVSRKRTNRRLQDSDEDEDETINAGRGSRRIEEAHDASDVEDAILKASAVPKEPNDRSASPDKADAPLDDSRMLIDAPESTQPIQPRSRKRLPVISDDSEDDDIHLKAALVREGKDDAAGRKNDGQPDDDNAMAALLRQSTLKQIRPRKKRPVISDDSDDDIGGRHTDGDIIKNAVGQSFKKRRPVVDESDDEGEPKGRSDLTSWQSEGGESAHDEVQRKLSVDRSPKPAAPGSDSDESDLDRVILKKHCTVAFRRTKFASKPNPEFLDDLLKNICLRSRHIGLESERSRSKSDSPPNLSEAGVPNDKADNDSIELEFSDDDERKLYSEQFKSQVENQCLVQI